MDLGTQRNAGGAEECRGCDMWTQGAWHGDAKRCWVWHRDTGGVMQVRGKMQGVWCENIVGGTWCCRGDVGTQGRDARQRVGCQDAESRAQGATWRQWAGHRDKGKWLAMNNVKNKKLTSCQWTCKGRGHQQKAGECRGMQRVVD